MSDDIKKLASATYNKAFEALEAGEDLVSAVELAATSLNMWRRVGNDRNLTIGYWLYARALAFGGAADLALAASRKSLDHLKNVDSPADWMVASALEGYARSAVAAGLPNVADANKAAADAIARIEDAEDRELIAGQFADIAG